jgi:hypothetical protein
MACETTRSDKSPNPKEALLQTSSISIIVFGKTQHTFVDLLFALLSISSFPVRNLRPYTSIHQVSREVQIRIYRRPTFRYTLSELTNRGFGKRSMKYIRHTVIESWNILDHSYH